MKQIETPQPAQPQVSVFETIKIVFGAAEADRILHLLALNPGRDVVAIVNPKTLELLCQLRTKKV